MINKKVIYKLVIGVRLVNTHIKFVENNSLMQLYNNTK